MKRCPTCQREFSDDTSFCSYDGKFLRNIRKGHNDWPSPKNVDSYIGIVLDHKYHIESKIAEGGMGNVYRARHLQLEIPVAVKLMLPELVADETSMERFRREAQATMQIRHPNAIMVTDFGVSQEDIVYLVMEYLEGCTLRRRLIEVNRFSIFETNNIIQQICAAVSAAHKRQIIHRDLKPDNIFLQSEGGEEIVKVLDFGIAKLKKHDYTADKTLTRQGVVMGTPHYMSPEQCYGKEVDVRSDVYSIGIIAYELLTGFPPFDSDNALELAVKQATEKPRPIYEYNTDVCLEINNVIMKALEKHADNRPQTVMAFAQELDKIIKDIAFYMAPPDISAIIEKREELDDKKTPATFVPIGKEAPSLDLGAFEQLVKPPKSSTTKLPDLEKVVPTTSEVYKQAVAHKDPSQRDIVLPIRGAKAYPVLCETCGKEVGRSMIAGSTIVCPDCRARYRNRTQPLG